MTLEDTTTNSFWRKNVGVRVHLSAPAAAVTALSLLCLVLVVAGGAYPLTERSNWQWSWESPALAFAGYGLATVSLVGAVTAAWRGLHGGGWGLVAVAAAFVVLGTVAILLLSRAGTWLPDFRAQIVADQ